MTEKPPGQDPIEPGAEPRPHEAPTPGVAPTEDDRDAPWWRWFAGLWAVLAVAAVVAGNRGLLGMALTFTAGFSNHELRNRKERAGGTAVPKLALLAAATAALGAVGVYLLLRYEFGRPMPWWGSLPLFAALLVVNLAGPTALRLLRRSAPGSRDT